MKGEENMSYTLPNGRQASKREQRERERLMIERDNCPDCQRATEDAVKNCNDNPGACQCPKHRSYGNY